MTNRERLLENYEDALFALLMDDVARAEGERLIRENEALQTDPRAAVPDDIDLRCRRTIQRAFAKLGHSMTAARWGKRIGKVAVVAAIISTLFISAYASSPSFRAGTLNLLLEIDDKLATWQFNDGGLPQLPEGTDEAKEIGFDIGSIPKGYTITDIESFPNQTHIQCENTHGIKIYVDVFEVGNAAAFAYDTEDADYYEEINIKGFPAILVDKDGTMSIAWADERQGSFYSVFSADATTEELEEFVCELY